MKSGSEIKKNQNWINKNNLWKERTVIPNYNLKLSDSCGVLSVLGSLPQQIFVEI